ncbi:MAG: Ig-like domain-containing protein, partial [Proteocatella sp.]
MSRINIIIKKTSRKVMSLTLILVLLTASLSISFASGGGSGSGSGGSGGNGGSANGYQHGTSETISKDSNFNDTVESDSSVSNPTESGHHGGSGSSGSNNSSDTADASGNSGSDTTESGHKGGSDSKEGVNGNNSVDNVIVETGKASKGGSSGVEITVLVSGLQSGKETTVTLEKKAEENEMPYIDKIVTVDQVAIFSVPAGGSCTIQGEAVPGYITPSSVDISLTQLQGNFSILKSLVYSKGSIHVSGISLRLETLLLLEGESKAMEFSITPSNANNQSVIWQSSDRKIVQVDNSGNVLAVSKGSAIINVRTQDGSFTDECNVTVGKIKSISDIPDINAFTGKLISLPNIVGIEVELEAESIYSDPVFVPVKWIGASTVDNKQYVLYNSVGIYKLIGQLENTTMTAEIDVYVTGIDNDNDVYEATGITLDKSNLSVYIANENTLSIIDSIPKNADLSSLIWSTIDPAVAKISSISDNGNTATLTGVSAGTTLVTIKNWKGTVMASCLVSVAVDPTLTDPVYILATTEDSYDSVDQFDSKEAVFIRGFNLPEGTYHVKIEAKGKNPILAESTNQTSVKIGPNTTECLFKLVDAVNFNLTDSFSKSYFVSMSTDKNYPSGDYEDGTPKTLTDNFKIGSPVPTGSIEVEVIQEFDNMKKPLNSDLIGTEVFLARELSGYSAFDIQLADYLNPYYDPEVNSTLYTDEIKMYGTVNASGGVDWKTPKESLKIGGYYLLMDLPVNYSSNLNEVNPLSEDGELLKEVHIKRDEVVKRQIIVQEFNPILDRQNLSVYVDGTAVLSAITDDPAYTQLQWESANQNIATVTPVPDNEKSVTVTGIGVGTTRINLKTGDEILAFCTVNVSIDPTLTDPVYIIATTADSYDSVDQFDSKEAIFIRGFNLPEGTYHVKIEAKGKNPILAESTVQTDVKIGLDTTECLFQLVDVVDFNLSNSFSESYFVSMSKDKNYPSGDYEDGTPKTLTDNFKIGSPVPTGFIDVDVNQLRYAVFGAVDEIMIGKDVILCRELDQFSAAETQYEHYLNPLHVNHPEVSI